MRDRAACLEVSDKVDRVDTQMAHVDGVASSLQQQQVIKCLPTQNPSHHKFMPCMSQANIQ